MIIIKEFIWRTDHYAYHITNIEAMKNICNEGLKPLCGERSKSVGDDIKGIFFFDSLYSVNKWINALYENKDIHELELLRFNLKQRKWIMQNPSEFYLVHKVRPDKIEYLRLFDENKNMYLPLNNLPSDYFEERNDIKLNWNNLDNYKVLKKV